LSFPASARPREAVRGRVLAMPQQTAGSSAIIGR